MRLVGESAHAAGQRRIAKVARAGARAGARRVRHRQGWCTRHPRLQPPRRRPSSRWCSAIPGLLEANSSAPEGVLHRRQRRPRRLFPGRQRQHAVPRRDRRPAAGHAVKLLRRSGAQRAGLGSTQEESVDVRRQRHHRTWPPTCRPAASAGTCSARLNVIEILVPPLRGRRGPAALCQALLARIAQETGMARRRCRPMCWSSTVAPAARQRARTGEPAAPRPGAVRRQPAAGRFAPTTSSRRLRRRTRARRRPGVAPPPCPTTCRPTDSRSARSGEGAARARFQRRRHDAWARPAPDPLPHRPARHRDAEARCLMS